MLFLIKNEELIKIIMELNKKYEMLCKIDIFNKY